MASSSFSSCLTPQSKYDVFISFRGEDTRENFISHLIAALCRKKIETFIDEDLNIGEEISPALLNAIEGSKISIIIFSKDYASSKWCLDELVKILECKKRNGQIVIPIFYHVHPSDVGKQTKHFEEAFVEHEKRFKKMPEKVQKWRDALTEVSKICGFTKSRTEAELVDLIVYHILKKLKNASISSDLNGLVGLNSRIEHIKSLLHIGLPDFRIVGIWGMGGMGKTTIAKALFNKISCEFEGKCFMANVREELEEGVGLVHLQKRVLSQLLEENLEVEDSNIPQYTKERLRCMKVFIVLDDVNKFWQLEYLTGGLDRFGPGSRIIITTRYKQVLNKYGVHYIYKVQGFNYSEALEIFCNHAFKEDYCPQDLMKLTRKVVKYADGHPLALKVLGSSLYRKTEENWERALHKLQLISNPGIYNMLKISYDELSWEEKNLFLDIACFFKGYDKDHVAVILDDRYSVHYGLSVLVSKSLIRISSNKLQMHDLLQEMGREIVRQESIIEPGKRSRLWHHEDVYEVLKKNTGTDSIQGIFLDISKVRGLRLSSLAFAKMSNLTMLKFYSPMKFGVSDMHSKVHLPHGLEYLPSELRYLHWHGYPLKMLPRTFNPENLIELNLPYSKVEQLWKGKKEAFMLKWIDVRHCQNLTRIPDSSETPNLKSILSNSTNLPSMPSDIENFNNPNVKSLRSFPSNIHFRDCSELNEQGKNIVGDSLPIIPYMATASLRLFNFYEQEFGAPPGVDICFPGSGVPEWFSNQCLGSSITIQLPENCCNKYFVGFALCAVFGFEDYSHTGQHFQVKCSYCFEINTPSKTKQLGDTVYSTYSLIECDHVLLGFYPFRNARLPEGDHRTTVSCDFSIAYMYSLHKILPKVKCCGLCPVYAHPNEFPPNTFTINMQPPREQECTQLVIMSGSTESISIADEEEVEPISREQINAPQQCSFLSNIFLKTKNLVAVGGLTALVFGVYFYSKRAVGDMDELRINLKSRKTSKRLEESKP